MLTPLKESYDQLSYEQLIKLLPKQTLLFNKDPSNQGYGFSSGHLWMTQSWTVKKAKHRRMDAFEL